MKSIVRSYVIVTAAILCLTLLVTGIIGVNQETSYVMSGEREEVLKVQSTTSQRLLLETEENVYTVDAHDAKTVAVILASILPSPLAHIVWAVG